MHIFALLEYHFSISLVKFVPLKKITIVNINKKYNTPVIEYLEITLESAILNTSSGNLENPREGEESGW